MSVSVHSRRLAFLDILVVASDMRQVGLPQSMINRSLAYLVGAAERSMAKGEDSRATSPANPSSNLPGDPRRN